MQGGILFDLDGTLLDTAPDFTHTLNILLEAHDSPPMPLNKVRSQVSGGARALIKLGFNINPDHATYPDLFERFLTLYAEFLGDRTKLFPGVQNLLEHLNQKGVAWGIVTNKPHRFTEPLLKQWPLLQKAACVVSGDTLAHAKPHPLPVQHACEKMNIVPKHSLFVGDAKVDIEASHSAGLKSCLVDYGYLPDNEDVNQWQATHRVSLPEAIFPVFERIQL